VFDSLRIKKDNGIERLYIEMTSMGLSREEVIAWAKKKVDDLNGSSAPILQLLQMMKIFSH